MTLARPILTALIAILGVLTVAPHDTSAGVVPGTAYIEGGTGFIYFNSSGGFAGPGAAEAAVSYATSPNRYIFGDSGGMTPGAGCSAVDAFTVSCPRAAPTQVRVQIGDNDATDFNVFTTAGDFVQVLGGTGDDNLLVYSTVGNMRWVGYDGTDRLVVRDLEHLLGRTYSVTWDGGFETYVNRTGISGAIAYQSSVERIELLVGESVAQTVNLEMAPSWADIYVKLNNGSADVVQVSPAAGVAASVSAAIEVEGAPTDVVLIHDVNGAAATYTAVGDTIDRDLGFGGLTYGASVGQINVYGSAAGATFNVSSSTAPLALFGTAANDTANIGNSLTGMANVAYIPGAGIDALNVDDSGGVGYSYQLNENVPQLTRSGSGGVSWDNSTLEQVTLTGGNLGDAFFVNAWYPAITINGQGGDDTINVRADGAKAGTLVTGAGGPGNDDTVVIENALSLVDATFEVDGAAVTRFAQPLVNFSSTETFFLTGGAGIDTVHLRGTLQGTHYSLLGNGNNDVFTVGPDLTDMAGAASITGGNGTDMVTVNDTSGPAGGVYEIRDNRIGRFGHADVQLQVEQARLNAANSDSIIRLLSTRTDLSIRADGAAFRDDDFYVFAAGLAPTGSALLDGRDGTFDSSDDLVRLYTGGTGATFSGNSIVTPGRHNVSLSNMEQLATVSSAADADGDGCTDLQEIGLDESFGGLRDPSNRYDFYDVSGDKAVDLIDTLTILARFGALPGDGSYDVLFDRVAGPALQPWRSQQAAGTTIGIDLGDALASLQQFGHSCV